MRISKETAMKVSDVQRGYNAVDNRPRRKARLNITVDADLLETAREHGLNLSMMMEAKITEAIKEKKREDLRAAIKEYAKDYNKMIEEEGIWSDGLRQF
jgi:antitoxin CcdA